MPKANPKHQKRNVSTTPMGTSKAAKKCSVKTCSTDASHNLASSNIEGYTSQLGWSIDIEKKVRRIALCKKHYKQYKKLKNKDEKYTRFKDFGPSKGQGKQKSHAFME